MKPRRAEPSFQLIESALELDWTSIIAHGSPSTDRHASPHVTVLPGWFPPPTTPAAFSDTLEREALSSDSCGAICDHSDESRATPAGGDGKVDLFRPDQARPASSVPGEGA